jgi:DNA-binding NarL/FixJ family response regulator
MAEKQIKIIIVDDHPLVRQGMKKVIEKEQDLTVINEAGSAEEAIRLISQEEPELAIVDISLESEASGIDLIKALRDRYARIKTLVLSMHDENVYAERALRAGARGYVAKKEAPAVIIEAIRTVMKGELYLSGRISMKIIDRLFQGKDTGAESLPEILSDRELEIFRMIGNGMGTGEIAKKLNISVNTIESHRKKIKDKLGIQKGSELVKAAVQWAVSQNK